jgi:hypothetical protein
MISSTRPFQSLGDCWVECFPAPPSYRPECIDSGRAAAGCSPVAINRRSPWASGMRGSSHTQSYSASYGNVTDLPLLEKTNSRYGYAGRSTLRWPVACTSSPRSPRRSIPRYVLRYVKIGCIRIPKGEVIFVSPTTGCAQRDGGECLSAQVSRRASRADAIEQASKVVASDGGGLTGTNGHPVAGRFNSETGSTVCIWRARMSDTLARSVSVAICSQHQLAASKERLIGECAGRFQTPVI